MKRVVLASGNAGKLREFNQMLAPLGWEVLSQAALGVKATDEPFTTFVENALRKARNAAAQTGMAALADDSGICVPALHGAPGVHSARYAEMAGQGSGDEANNRLLVSALEHCADRRAFYYCVLVWVAHADDPTPVISEGRWWGEVVARAYGDGGFGYDPHFWLPAEGLTVAQLGAEEKNRLSHRGIAMRQLLASLAGTPPADAQP